MIIIFSWKWVTNHYMNFNQIWIASKKMENYAHRKINTTTKLCIWKWYMWKIVMLWFAVLMVLSWYVRSSIWILEYVRVYGPHFRVSSNFNFKDLSRKLTFWHNLTRLMGCRMFYQGDSVQAILLNSLHRYRDRRSRSKWGVIFFAGCWFIWKNRNCNIFEGMDPGVAADHVRKEAMLWLRYC